MSKSVGGHDDGTGQRLFGDLGTSIVEFQGGYVIVHCYGCQYCSNAFWTEDDAARRLKPGSHPCPHCGKWSTVPR